MNDMNITSFQKNIFSVFEQAIKFNQPVNISTKDGNAVVISEADYRSLVETLYFSSVPGLKEQILAGMKEPLSESKPENEVTWCVTGLCTVNMR